MARQVESKQCWCGQIQRHFKIKDISKMEHWPYIAHIDKLKVKIKLVNEEKKSIVLIICCRLITKLLRSFVFLACNAVLLFSLNCGFNFTTSYVE